MKTRRFFAAAALASLVLFTQLACQQLTPEQQRALNDYRRSQQCCNGGGP